MIRLAWSIVRAFARGLLSPASLPYVAAEAAELLARALRRALISDLPTYLDDLDRPDANAVGLQDWPHEGIVGQAASIVPRLTELYPGGEVMGAVPLSPIARENRFDVLIGKAADRFDVPAAIVKGVIATESSFNPNAIREEPKIHDRSRGLMQLLEGTARGLGFIGDPKLLHDPEVNIMLGAALLSQLHARFGSWPDALAAYNGGKPRKNPDGSLVPMLASYVAKVERHVKRMSPADVGLALVGGGSALSILALAGIFLLSLRKGGGS